MDQGKLKKGAIYYQCGEAAAPAGFGILITTWVYEGYVHDERSGSSASCEVPHHFYSFLDYDDWSRQQAEGGGDARMKKLYIPNLRQAELSMLTWDELLQPATRQPRGPRGSP
jgi:hypothetical protein